MTTAGDKRAVSAADQAMIDEIKALVRYCLENLALDDRRRNLCVKWRDLVEALPTAPDPEVPSLVVMFAFQEARYGTECRYIQLVVSPPRIEVWRGGTDQGDGGGGSISDPGWEWPPHPSGHQPETVALEVFRTEVALLHQYRDVRLEEPEE